MDKKRLPLIVILGATGSGKTKLSLELAQRFKGEIIGADSMQIYKGLDIITAKAKREERQLIKHHMIDILEPYESFTVVEYRDRAIKIIDDLFNRRILPIIVGGTNYYIESLLWKILISNTNNNNNKVEMIENDKKLTNIELHEKLKQYDPNMAKRLHPNNKRKILRSLEIFYQTGRQHSDLIDEQQNSHGGSLTGGGLRYQNALIFKLHCQQDILDIRLNDRVDQMINDGLIDELTDFHLRYNQNRLLTNQMIDYTKGVFQSIGLKEFHEFLLLKPTDRDTDVGRTILQNCIDELKMVTRRYARRQEKWTKNRFLGRHDREVPPMYSLDVNDVTKWNENVLQPAIEILNNYQLNINDCNKYQPMEKIDVINQLSNACDDTFFCDICERIFIGNHQWSIHLKSHKHKKMLERKRRLEKL